jgi:plasmid stabilization system protein ParE
MASVLVSPRAQRNLERLIQTHALPDSTLDRFRRSIEPLGRFPLLGAPLSGRWDQFRFVLGPWRWMIVVYAYDETADQVAIVTVQDGRSARAATSA